jgi:hypothetical protein
MPVKTPAKKKPAPAKAAPRRALAKKPAAVATRRAPAKKTAAAPPPLAMPAAKDAAKKPAKLRVRLVRDSFTMPEPDFALIAALKSRTLAAQRETKKSELLRAGLHVLMALDDDTLLSALGRLQPLKLGRPKKNH